MTLQTLTWTMSRGFLPDADPPQTLPPSLAALDQLGAELPKILLAESPRKLIEELPPLDLSVLRTREDSERAMALLSFIGHGYVWGEKKAPGKIPACLAVPWYELSLRVGRPPTLSYPSYALYNWRRLKPSEPVALGNIALLQNFLSGVDEEWFVLIHVDIEMLAAPAVRALKPAQAAVQKGDEAALLKELQTIAGVLEKMNVTMNRMPENCDPYVYYMRVRPYIHGWKNNPHLPNGLVYEGVDAYQGKPQMFRGETGSQSSIIPCLDACLGIKHKEDELAVYLREMRDYMSPEHRALLTELESSPSMRQTLIDKHSANAALKDAFNACIDGINKFRTKHLDYASEYIDKQSQTSKANPTKVGTGGTPFMTYLKKHQVETEQQKI